MLSKLLPGRTRRLLIIGLTHAELAALDENYIVIHLDTIKVADPSVNSIVIVRRRPDGMIAQVDPTAADPSKTILITMTQEMIDATKTAPLGCIRPLACSFDLVLSIYPTEEALCRVMADRPRNPYNAEPSRN